MRNLTAFLLLLASCAWAGCYDGERLIERASADARENRLEEVDLGTYRITMPTDQETAQTTEVRFQLFGNTPRYRLAKIKATLEERGYQLRYETLAAVRAAPPEELTEPDLARLKTRIEKVVNGILEETPVESIGFTKVAFSDY